ncbi:4Fe-4S dicluster domain-containing protein [Vaginella massiliensis]|uniref:4Fe-4S dicluster domain-containing protein n=1 Tax=Vaginella massiliensis TaxID=1816680 RepID=UPI003751406E
MIQYLPNIIFAVLLVVAATVFVTNAKKILRNIRLGQPITRWDRKDERWKTMARVAFGQSKMTVRPIPAFLHLIVYIGFLLINIEVIEILIDGLFGTHRVLSFMGGFYNFMIGFFEILAFGVILACVLFFIRRNIVHVRRLVMGELNGWPKTDANLILLMEVSFMVALLLMNGADATLQARQYPHFVEAGGFPISSWLTQPLFENLPSDTVLVFERAAWWFHIIGIFFFANYLYYSKHLHIILAFPNTWFSKLEPKAEFNNLASVTNEVKMMMDPNADPYAMPAEGTAEEPSTFGAKDIFDLNQVQLLNAYTCTECGRCTSECPANLTGKKLSPRKIMMDTRDRIEDVSRILDANNGQWKDDGKTLVNDYISAEELWACTSCNACTQACPVNIDPLSIIVDLRRYLVMEQSAAPQELNLMMANIENNGAPWQFNTADRLNWAND